MVPSCERFCGGNYVTEEGSPCKFLVSTRRWDSGDVVDTLWVVNSAELEDVGALVVEASVGLGRVSSHVRALLEVNFKQLTGTTKRMQNKSAQQWNVNRRFIGV